MDVALFWGRCMERIGTAATRRHEPYPIKRIDAGVCVALLTWNCCCRERQRVWVVEGEARLDELSTQWAETRAANEKLADRQASLQVLSLTTGRKGLPVPEVEIALVRSVLSGCASARDHRLATVCGHSCDGDKLRRTIWRHLKRR